MKHKKLLITAVLAAAAVVLIQAGRHAGAYPVSPVPLGKGIGSTLYIASCEPYHPYLELERERGRDWVYLFQAPLAGEDFDETVEKILFNGPARNSTHMNRGYRTVTYRADPAYPGAVILSEDTLVWKRNTHIQKKVNALAPKTSQEEPLYFVWCGGSLYGVIGERAYLLWQGPGGKLLLSLPEFRKTEHTPCVVSRGPISEDDYYEQPSSASTTS